MLTPEPAFRQEGAKLDHPYPLVNEARVDAPKEAPHV
jgi:hypothetical protein